jgi:D-arabinan exo alpha-(1,3)/(1,5)-arabinofuranosidase (non-reducing end)
MVLSHPVQKDAKRKLLIGMIETAEQGCVDCQVCGVIRCSAERLNPDESAAAGPFGAWIGSRLSPSGKCRKKMIMPPQAIIGILLTTCMALLAGLGEPRAVVAQQPPDLIHEPYRLDTGLVSRSISFENPTGESGAGGQAASPLGVGRKGAPARQIMPREEVMLCDVEGPGTIRHFWLTTDQSPVVQRACVLRAYWEGQANPSIECPIGDFFGCAHGKITVYQSAVHSVGPTGGRNIWLPMPFVKRAKWTFTNESRKPVPLYYQIDYTLGDKHSEDVGRLHTVFRRENPTVEKRDFELLPLRKQRGRYVGSVIGIRNLHAEQWWGEGEIKVYMDGDCEFPTICGTGSEDYIGLAWGVQLAPFFYNGCSLNEKNFVTMYRWHLPDPIAWQREGRITIQQIAAHGKLLETSDDWSCATFWYEPVPSQPLPKMPDLNARTANIWTD